MSNHKPGSGIKSLLRERLPGAVFEAVFVVLAVLVALAVDEYWEGREERELAEIAKSRIVAEIRGNIDELLTGEALNQALLRDIDEALAADAAREPVSLTGVEYEVLLLGSDAWETASATRAVHFMDFDIVSRISKVYRIQQLFLDRQDLVVDAIGNSGGGGGDRGFDDVLRPIRSVLAVAVELECQLMHQYRVLLADLESDETPLAPADGADQVEC